MRSNSHVKVQAFPRQAGKQSQRAQTKRLGQCHTKTFPPGSQVDCHISEWKTIPTKGKVLHGYPKLYLLTRNSG